MNTNIVTPTSHSVAFQFGQQDAQRGEPCVPEAIFVRRADQVEYCRGYEAVSGVTLTTAQFTGSPLPQRVQVAHKRRDGGEYLRWTDLCAEKSLKASAARNKRIAAMIDLTAKLLPEMAGDIIFAV
jgi:hypothetical protein